MFFYRKDFPQSCSSFVIFLCALFAFAGNVSAQDSPSKIHAFIENRDYQNAVIALETLKKDEPKIFELNDYDYLLARTAEKIGDFATAQVNYQIVARRDSVLRQYALWHLSQIAHFTGNLFLEKIYLQRILITAPESLLNETARRRLAQSSFESKNFAAAIDLLNNPNAFYFGTAQTNKTSAGQSRETLALLGAAYLQSGKLNDARDIFIRLISESPNAAQPDDYALNAALKLDEMQTDKAVFDKAAPDLSETEHYRRAQIYQFNRNFARARLHFAALIKKFPASQNVPDALFQIGRGYAQERAFDVATNWFERVIAEFPATPAAKNALNQLAGGYAHLGKYKEAVSRYRQIIAQYPNDEIGERAFLNIVDTLRDKGENGEALAQAMRTREVFRGKTLEAIALFAQTRIHISQNDWQNALNDLGELQTFADLGATKTGGTNKNEVLFLKGFVLENLNRYAEAIEIYLLIPDGRNEYYGWRATERLQALANDEQTKFFATKKYGELVANIETRNAEAQRKAAQAALRLTSNQEIRAKMFEIVKKSYATLPDYQKVPNGKFSEIGRKEVLREKRENSAGNYHQTIADALLFLGLYDEAAPEFEVGQKSEVSEQKANPKTEIRNPKSDGFTLAVLYKRGEMANRAIAYIEPLWKNMPADYQIELIPREQIEMLYPAPYADALLEFAPPKQIDPRFELSIMRQESRFRADVKSYAAARGLMQFIGTTANATAIQLNRENFNQDELYNPPTAILFGSQYLAELFKKFPNQPPAVAASYNGGEDNMARWLARAKSDDPRRYVPEIIFSQSKDYVYKVMANYRVYQIVYDENLKAK